MCTAAIGCTVLLALVLHIIEALQRRHHQPSLMIDDGRLCLVLGCYRAEHSIANTRTDTGFELTVFYRQAVMTTIQLQGSKVKDVSVNAITPEE